MSALTLTGFDPRSRLYLGPKLRTSTHCLFKSTEPRRKGSLNTGFGQAKNLGSCKMSLRSPGQEKLTCLKLDALICLNQAELTMSFPNFLTHNCSIIFKSNFCLLVIS